MKKTVLVIHFNQWGDTELYKVRDPSDEQLQLVRDSQFTQTEADELLDTGDKSEAMALLEALLEDDWKYNVLLFGPWNHMENGVDLVLFCGVTKGPSYE